MPHHQKRSMDGSDNHQRKNIIIAGVNKGGTTSLFSYLAAHPEICPANVKETCFFLPIRYDEPISQQARYDSFFTDCSPWLWRLESTPGYFYGGRRLAQAISDRLDAPRIVVVLREPVDRAYSFFKFMKSMMQLEPAWSFDEYADTCLSMPKNEKTIRGNNRFWGVDGGYYADYLQEWLDVFGDRLKVVFFDDLRDRPITVLRDLCSWIDIEPEFFADDFDVSVENKTVSYRNPTIHTAALFVNRVAEKLFRANPGFKRKLRSVYRRINRGADEPGVSHATRQKLNDLYEPSIKRLRSILLKRGDTNLPGWLSE